MQIDDLEKLCDRIYLDAQDFQKKVDPTSLNSSNLPSIGAAWTALQERLQEVASQFDRIKTKSPQSDLIDHDLKDIAGILNHTRNAILTAASTLSPEKAAQIRLNKEDQSSKQTTQRIQTVFKEATELKKNYLQTRTSTEVEHRSLIKLSTELDNLRQLDSLSKEEKELLNSALAAINVVKSGLALLSPQSKQIEKIAEKNIPFQPPENKRKPPQKEQS